MNKLTAVKSKKEKRREKIVVMMLRCKYMESDRIQLSEQGEGLFSCRVYRMINNFKMKWFSKWREDVLEFFREVQGDEILSTAFRYDELFEKHFHPGDDGPPVVTLDDAYDYTQKKSIEFAIWCEQKNYLLTNFDEYTRMIVYKEYLRERSKRQDQQF